MSVGFIMYEIVDKDSPKYQGINTSTSKRATSSIVGYSLKYQGINTCPHVVPSSGKLDIHLNIKALTPKGRNTMNSNRLSQKLSEFFECSEIESAFTPTIF